MAEKTLAENVETATKVIKEVKESIQAKGVEIPEGTHATRYPEYIEKMKSETDFSELEERVSSVEEEVEEIKEVTVWGQKLSGDVTGNLSNVGFIRFASDSAHSIGTNEKRPNTVYIRGSVRTGEVNSVGDGNSGAFLNNNGLLALSSSPEDTEEGKYPRIVFLNGGTNYLSAIKEGYPGVLSIPNKLKVGTTTTEEQVNTLVVDGTFYVSSTSFHQGYAHFGAEKTSYLDGRAGVTIGPAEPYIALTPAVGSSEHPRVIFGRNGTEITSRVLEGYPGVLTLQTVNDEGVYIGTNARTVSLDGYRLMVSGDSYLNGEAHIEGKIWMDKNKIHLGTYKNGVSGISYINGRGVVIESGINGIDGDDNIELYTKLNGNIVLNTTNGKALYKDAEVATADDISALKSEITELKQQIAALLAAR